MVGHHPFIHFWLVSLGILYIIYLFIYPFQIEDPVEWRMGNDVRRRDETWVYNKKLKKEKRNLKLSRKENKNKKMEKEINLDYIKYLLK